MAAKKQADEGVPLNLTVDKRYADGVPVKVPQDASDKSESKSTAKSAASTKEK
jgi:hypothetical protein